MVVNKSTKEAKRTADASVENIGKVVEINLDDATAAKLETMSDEEVENYLMSFVDSDELKNSADHPYILDLGGHSSYVGENILLEQMAFRKAKKAMNLVILGAKHDKKAMQYWESYGMLPDQMSPFEQAILKGVKFDYQAIASDFSDMCEGKSNEFIARFESLFQICQIKTIESKLLSIFDSEIQREKSNGQVAIYQNIVTATEYIYNLFATGLAEHTRLMKETTFDGYFVEETKKWFGRKKNEYPKDILLEDYLEMPKNLTNECIEVAVSLGISEDELEALCDSLEGMTQAFSEANAEMIKAIHDQVEGANVLCNESMEYVRPAVDKQDLMFN